MRYVVNDYSPSSELVRDPARLEVTDKARPWFHSSCTDVRFLLGWTTSRKIHQKTFRREFETISNI
jgi:hypothetical protein